MTEEKINFGIRLTKRLADNLDEVVDASIDMHLTRSELIEAIVAAFFSSRFDSIEKGREFVTVKRNRESK